MKPTLFIHAGMHKTATSTIQNLLYDNRDTLNKYGWYYPLSGLLYGGEIGNRHFYLQNEIFQDIDYNYWNNLVLELSENNTKNIILSHENFLSPRIDPFVIKKLLPNYHIKIIVYFRHPVDYIESCYREWVRRVGQYDKDIETFYQWRKRWLSYEKLVNKWDEAIGSENVIVRLFNKDDFIGESIEKDFLTMIGLENLKFDSNKKNNESLSSRQILLYLLKNRKHIDKDQMKPIESTLNNILHKNVSDLRILNDELVKSIIKEFDKDFIYIQDRLGKKDRIESKYAKLDHDVLFDIVKKKEE